MKNTKTILCGFLYLLMFYHADAQSFAINTDGSTANASALLDVKSTAKGVLIPRMTKSEKNTIASPATGLLIFQHAPDSIGFHYYNGTTWQWLLDNSTADTIAWKTTGNTGINPTQHFIGTINNAALVFKTNSNEKMRLTANGELGLGTTTPNSTYGFAKLEIASEGFGVPTDLLIRNAVNSAGYAPGLVFQHARGTLATPLAVVNGDYLHAISSLNYDGTSYVLSMGIDVFTDGVVATGIVPSRIQFGTTNTTGSYGYRMTIKNDGKIGIGTTAPNSTLQVDGSIAIGVTMGLTGGTIATPVALVNQKTYIGCSPADNTNNFYQLPDPALYPGRIYYIRNNSSSFFANIVTAAGNIFPGGSNTVVSGNTYTLNPTTSVKTIICISDGTNWTVGKID